MRFGTGIRTALLLFREHLQPGSRHLYKQLVVAYQTEIFPVTVQTVLPEHFLEGNFPGMPELETNIFYKIRRRGHVLYSHIHGLPCKL